jgi:type III pantothenate kinase
MKNSFFIAVDIGNTSVTIGAFPLIGLRPLRVLKVSTREPISRHAQALRRFQTQFVRGIAIASVVPALDLPFQKICRDIFHPSALLITHRIKTGVRILTDRPSQVGADRIVNACAAHKFFGRKTIVIDFGTATTFDCVSRQGEYLGGVICPGPRLSAKALAMHTAKLPFVSMAKPRRVIGKNTADCIRSGLFYGYLGLVREILSGVQKEMGSGAFVVATGGDAPLIAPHVSQINRVAPHLTLQGIKMIWEMNQRRRNK